MKLPLGIWGAGSDSEVDIMVTVELGGCFFEVRPGRNEPLDDARTPRKEGPDFY
jgi:hypothetical protein